MGDLSSVAAEGEVFSQDPRPVPPDQGDAAHSQQGHHHTGADEIPDGQDGQERSAAEETSNPPRRHHRMATTAMPTPSRSEETLRSSQEGQGPILVPPVASAIDQQGQGQGAQHPAGHGGDEKIVSGR